MTRGAGDDSGDFEGEAVVDGGEEKRLVGSEQLAGEVLLDINDLSNELLILASHIHEHPLRHHRIGVTVSPAPFNVNLLSQAHIFRIKHQH